MTDSDRMKFQNMLGVSLCRIAFLNVKDYDQSLGLIYNSFFNDKPISSYCYKILCFIFYFEVLLLIHYHLVRRQMKLIF